MAAARTEVMECDLFWLCLKGGDNDLRCPYWAESGQDALPHGMEHVLGRELVTPPVGFESTTGCLEGTN